MEEGKKGSKHLIMSEINLFFSPVLLPTHKQNAFATRSFCTLGIVAAIFARSRRGLVETWRGEGRVRAPRGGCGDRCGHCWPLLRALRLSARRSVVMCEKNIAASHLAHPPCQNRDVFRRTSSSTRLPLAIPLLQLTFLFFHREALLLSAFLPPRHLFLITARWF